MTQQTFTVVGTSIRNGKRKTRFSNGDAVRRGKTMLATGNTEIALYQLPQALLKRAAESAYDELFRNRAAPTYSSACFDYNTIGRTPRPASAVVDRALQFIEDNK